jgi:hypothetical protein
MKKKINIYVLSFFFILFCSVVNSQTKIIPPEPKPAAPPPGLPIDGGLSLLLIGAVVYGAYQVKQKK